MWGPLEATPISTSPACSSPRGQHVALLDDPDQRAGDVERARCVDARHLRRLATQQRAASGLARLGHAGDDLGNVLGIDLARCDVVEEEQRAGALHQHVVDAVVDDVGADAAVAAEAGGELDLGADAVGRGDQHGFVHRLDGLAAERAAEATDAAKNGRAVGAFDGVLHVADRSRALVDVDTRRGVRRQHRAGSAPADVAREPASRRTRSSTSGGRRWRERRRATAPTPVTASTRPPVTVDPSEPARNTIAASSTSVEAADGLPDDRLDRVAGCGGDHGARRAVVNRQWRVGQRSVATGQCQRGEVGVDQRQHGLRLGVAEATVELDQSRTVGGQHQARRTAHRRTACRLRRDGR